jgi:manganese transport system ATP-binding protein
VPSAVVASGLTVARGRTPALRDVDLTIEAGTITALVGPNGSGKSTFLHAVSGLVAPERGELAVLGLSPRDARPRVAYVLQRTRLSAVLPISVREVVAMGSWMREESRAERRAAVDDALARLGLGDLADRQLVELSGGQRQRALVAQGLVQRADLLLLDEPLAGLDLPAAGAIAAVLVEERRRGATVVLATHDLAEAEQADAVVLLSGRVVAAGPPEDVITPEHLAAAYGVRSLASGAVVLDDPGHHHWPEHGEATAG